MSFPGDLMYIISRMRTSELLYKVVILTVYVAVDYLKHRRDFLFDYISFLWISLWIRGEPLLSTHQEFLHSSGTSRYHPTLAYEWAARPWLMVGQCSAYSQGIASWKKLMGLTVWNMTIFAVVVEKHAAKYLSKQTNLFSWARRWESRLNTVACQMC